MSDPDEQPGKRRSFTDVASLFQPIVPVAGTPVREASAPLPPPPEPIPTTLAPPITAPPPIVAPPVPVAPEPDAAPILPALADPAPTPPAPVALPAPVETWSPPPVRRRRPWRAVLLLMLALAASGAFWLADPATLRQLYARYARPHLPLPAPVAERDPPPNTAADQPAPAVTPEAVPPPPGAPAPAAEPPAPAPPPASPVAPEPPSPAPALTEPPAATPDPAPPPAADPAPVPQAAAASVLFKRVVVWYRRNQPGAEAEAGRIATRLLPRSAQVEVRPGPSTYRAGVVRYSRQDDAAIAASLAALLEEWGAGEPSAGEPTRGWSVRFGGSRQQAGQLEVWVP